MIDPEVNTSSKMMEPTINSAIKKGYFYQVRYLVRYQPTLKTLNFSDPVTGRSALCQCVFIDDIRWGVGLAYILIENGAKVSVKDKHGKNALHWSAALGKLQLTRVFLACLDYDVNMRDLRGNTALHYAASGGHLQTVECLLRVQLRFKQSPFAENLAGLCSFRVARNARNFACADAIADSVADTEFSPGPDLGPAAYSSRRSSLSSEGGCTGAPKGRRASANDRSSTPIVTDRNGLIVRGDTRRWAVSCSVRNRPQLLTTAARPASPRLQVDRSDYRIWQAELANSALPESDWRNELKRMYIAFAYQFGESFLKQSAPRCHDPEVYYADAMGVSKPRSSLRYASELGHAHGGGSTHNLFGEFKAAFSVSRRLSRRGSTSSQTTGVGGVIGKLGRRNSSIGGINSGFRPPLGSRQNSVVGRNGCGVGGGSGQDSLSGDNSSRGGGSTGKATSLVQHMPSVATSPKKSQELLTRPVSRQGQYSDDPVSTETLTADLLGSIKEHQEISAL